VVDRPVESVTVSSRVTSRPPQFAGMVLRGRHDSVLPLPMALRTPRSTTDQA
jgi:hypothetical protein